jgi:hypothetical protein
MGLTSYHLDLFQILPALPSPAANGQYRYNYRLRMLRIVLEAFLFPGIDSFRPLILPHQKDTTRPLNLSIFEHIPLRSNKVACESVDAK